MKKHVVKGLSLGLSAVTLAGSTSITAFADEIDEITHSKLSGAKNNLNPLQKSGISFNSSKLPRYL